jgi:hypothetical protein
VQPCTESESTRSMGADEIRSLPHGGAGGQTRRWADEEVGRRGGGGQTRRWADERGPGGRGPGGRGPVGDASGAGARCGHERGARRARGGEKSAGGRRGAHMANQLLRYERPMMRMSEATMAFPWSSTACADEEAAAATAGARAIVGADSGCQKRRRAPRADRSPRQQRTRASECVDERWLT